MTSFSRLAVDLALMFEWSNNSESDLHAVEIPFSNFHRLCSFYESLNFGGWGVVCPVMPAVLFIN